MANQFVSTLLLLIASTSTYADGIVGGKSSSISSHSYLVRVQLADGTIVCGGALINSKTVVTAASCLTNYDADQFVVGANNGAKVVKIASYTFDTAYDFTTNENDIAVLKLAEAVSASYLSLASSLPSSGVLIGWDANNNVVTVSETIISAEDCVSGDYKYEDGEIFDSMLCGKAANSACGELPGSPLVSGTQLVGVVSWGYGCANKADPAVYASVPALSSWIKSNA